MEVDDDAIAAGEVLAGRFGLTDASLALVQGQSLNTFYRVSSQEGLFALRVGRTRIHPDPTEQVEAAWLDALGSYRSSTPQVVRTVEGSTSADVSGIRYSLFSWVPGVQLSKAPTAGRLRRSGALLAAMHEHAKGLAVDSPADLEFRNVVYFHSENLIDGLRSECGEMLREAQKHVQYELDQLWATPPHVPHLLHGDFGPANILVEGEELRPIDFQDLRVGFGIQDLAISLADLARDYPDLAAPFREGYDSVRSSANLTSDRLRAFAAGRSLNMLNLAMHLRRPGFDDFAERHAGIVRNWLQTRA